jgi:glycosyltransferase involved in cell wall biosynthesis
MAVDPSVRFSLLVLDSHPVQYRAPLYRYLSGQPWLDLTVWYGDDYGVVPRDSAWGVKGFTWDGDLLAGYRHRFLKNLRKNPDPSAAFGKINPELLSDLAPLRPDAVLILGYSSLFQWLSFWSARRAGIPILFLSETNAAAEPSGWKRSVKHAVLERLYRLIDAFLVIGSMNDRHYAQYGVPDRKRFFAPYSVDNRHFSEASAKLLPMREKLRASWGVAHGRDVLLFAGRLVGIKRPQDLVRAAAQTGDAHAVFCGGGPLEPELKALAESLLPGRATFLGFQNQGELPGIYAASDLLVLPSSYEPWGLVVNEAIASGLQAVASTLAGSAHDLVPEEFRFAPGDIQGMAGAIRAWRERRERDTGGMRKWFSDRISLFSYETVAGGFKDALCAVVRPAGGRAA